MNFRAANRITLEFVLLPFAVLNIIHLNLAAQHQVIKFITIIYFDDKNAHAI